ncbi:hypothetical protein B0H13DRAFT_1883848 [Mycena leptocephala]|nr:hypothetical protein B0H13DRAFT_1883848 [Mycena leptocephala]
MEYRNCGGLWDAIEREEYSLNGVGSAQENNTGSLRNLWFNGVRGRRHTKRNALVPTNGLDGERVKRGDISLKTRPGVERAEIEGAMKDSEFSADGESRAQRTQEDLGAGKVESCWRMLRAHKKGRILHNSDKTKQIGMIFATFSTKQVRDVEEPFPNRHISSSRAQAVMGMQLMAIRPPRDRSSQCLEWEMWKLLLPHDGDGRAAQPNGHIRPVRSRPRRAATAEAAVLEEETTLLQHCGEVGGVTGGVPGHGGSKGLKSKGMCSNEDSVRTCGAVEPLDEIHFTMNVKPAEVLRTQRHWTDAVEYFRPST